MVAGVGGSPLKTALPPMPKLLSRMDSLEEQGAGKFPERGYFFQNAAQTTDHGDEQFRNGRVKPVKGQDLDFFEAGPAQKPLNLPAEERGLVRRVPRHLFQKRYILLKGNLRIEHVGLGEAEHSPRFQDAETFTERPHDIQMV